MIAILQWTLAVLIIATSAGSVYFSYRSRRTADPKRRGLYAARMNICMGLMLLFIALIQMLLFSGSTLRVIVGALFMLLGLFNLFAGLRNHAYYSRLLRP
jgi:uncharacterized membrane protein